MPRLLVLQKYGSASHTYRNLPTNILTLLTRIMTSRNSLPCLHSCRTAFQRPIVWQTWYGHYAREASRVFPPNREIPVKILWRFQIAHQYPPSLKGGYYLVFNFRDTVTLVPPGNSHTNRHA